MPDPITKQNSVVHDKACTVKVNSLWACGQSEARPFFTAAQLKARVIASNLAFTVNDPSGLSFALISTSMFLTWQKTVVKSDLRFSTLTWNTFPVPALDEQTRQRIINAGTRAGCASAAPRAAL